ncbi:MAG: response regulator transcription factor [Chitinophagales bacterium]
MIHIAIADDQVLFRKGLAALIESFDDMHITLEAGTGRELIAALENSEELPDITLLDINMPEVNGIETLDLLKANYPYIKNIILTVHDAEKYIIKLIESGANAYLAKNCDAAEVALAIRTVYEKDFYFNRVTIDAMRNAFKYKKQKITLQPVDVLTKREREVLVLICKEYSSAEIAAALFLSERTVEGHRKNILQKTGCRNTAGLVIFAIRNELYEVPFTE